MGFFDRLKGSGVDRGVDEFRRTAGALLLDVRTPEEYRAGHIPGSRNLPLQTLQQAETLVKSKDQPLFVYCQSGARSSQATALLQRMGYERVKNIGGIAGYTGEVET